MHRVAAESWLEKYGNAWRNSDPAAAAKLFAEHCRYFETPFDDPAVGRDGVIRYWQAVPDGQTDIQFDWEIVAIVSNTVVVHWKAAFTRTANGVRVRLDGVFVLEFNDEGLCETLREWWHRLETPRTGA